LSQFTSDLGRQLLQQECLQVVDQRLLER